MNDERDGLRQALVHAREVLETTWTQERSATYSQGWVDRRRILLVDLLLQLAQETCEGSALDTRALAERMEAVLHTAQELAPGYGLDHAAASVLEGLAGNLPE